MRKLIEQLAEVIASYAAIDTELMWIAEACMQACCNPDLRSMDKTGLIDR